jgi:hypothetical protein
MRAFSWVVLLAGCNSGGLSLNQTDDMALGDLASRSDMAAWSGDMAMRDFASTVADLAKVADLAPFDMAPPKYDGVCQPAPMWTGVYDPDCVYLWGTLSEGACYRDALVHPANPTDYVAGFTCSTFESDIRPSDGRLMFSEYISGKEVARSFVVDAVSPVTTYPANPGANDFTLPTAGCQDIRLLHAFRDGTLTYQCSGQNGIFVEGSAAPIMITGSPLAFGAGRAILAANGSSAEIVDGAQHTSVTGLPSFTSVAATRSTPSGFMMAASSGTTFSLYDITLAGVATLRGSYQFGSHTSYHGCVLDPDGGLVCFTRGTASVFHDTVTRFTTTGMPTLVYDEIPNTVKIHISYLVTGP